MLNKCLLSVYTSGFITWHYWHLGLAHSLQWDLFCALWGVEEHPLHLPTRYYSTSPPPLVVTTKMSTELSLQNQMSSGSTGESRWSTGMREDLADAPKLQLPTTFWWFLASGPYLGESPDISLCVFPPWIMGTFQRQGLAIDPSLFSQNQHRVWHTGGLK